jgi:hypothetical protein
LRITEQSPGGGQHGLGHRYQAVGHRERTEPVARAYEATIAAHATDERTGARTRRAGDDRRDADNLRG